MKIHQVLTGLILVIVLSALGMIKSFGETQSVGTDTSGYFKDYHDPHYNFVVVKVTKIISPEKIISENMKYEGDVLADMRSTIKIGSHVTIIGESVGGGESLGSNFVMVETGWIEVFFLESTDQKDQFASYTRYPSPFGLEPLIPVVPASDVPLIAASLKELNTALKAPDALGPPRERAIALLKDKNPYLWALGCWGLIQDANREDIQLLKDQFSNRPEMTPAQALYLSDLFDFPGNGDGIRPDQVGKYQLLHGFLANYVRREIIGPQKPASSQQGLFPEEPEN